MVHMSDTEIINMQIKRIEKEIRDTPLHKATEHHIGRLRAKLSRLKEKEMDKASKKGGGGVGYAVKKQGDATIVLVGPPSAGKSTLLNRLTNAKSKVAPYSFTTLTVVPGMMTYKNAHIQILDVPGLIEGAEEGKGRGREVLSVVRGADLLIIMTDVKRISAFKGIVDALERNGIRLNIEPPRVTIDKKLSGGISLISNVKQPFNLETVKAIAKEYRLANADITIKEKLTIERLIDAFSKNRVYVPTLFAINKSDTLTSSLKKTKVPVITAFKKSDMSSSFRGNPAFQSREDVIEMSATEGDGVDKLKSEIWKNLKLARVFLVRGNEKPNKDHPLIISEGILLKDVAKKIGEEFSEGKKKAKIWGAGAKYPGQSVSLSKTVVSGMQIRFV